MEAIKIDDNTIGYEETNIVKLTREQIHAMISQTQSQIDSLTIELNKWQWYLARCDEFGIV